MAGVKNRFLHYSLGEALCLYFLLPQKIEYVKET